MRILIVDDDPGLRQSLGLLLREAGYDVEAEGQSEAALQRALAEPFDLILCDVRMPGLDGIAFVRRYRAERGPALVVMMSAHGAEDAALQAIRDGAYDYLSKPFRADEVLLTLRKAEERERLRREVETLRAAVGTDALKGKVVAESAAMRKVLELARRVAEHATTVLVTGESGTGKEVVANAIHTMSPRSPEPFVAINCAAIPEHLLESELFGHVRGAFTGATADRAGLFETADGGTLFLDEIGDLPLGLQAKLLRVLEDGEIRRVGARASRAVDVRLVAATSRDLERAVQDGTFREDLYYRLNVVRIHLPPLRERPEDVAALVTHFACEIAARTGRPVSVTPQALGRLTQAGWPGNVRQLRNALERAAVLSTTGVLDVEDFALEAVPASGPAAPAANGHAAPGQPLRLKPRVEQVEVQVIREALDHARGSRREAARMLGVSLRTLFYKMRRYDLA